MTQVEVIGSPSSHVQKVIATTIKDGISLLLSNEHLNSVQLEGAIWIPVRKVGESFWLLCSGNLMEVLIKVSMAESCMSKPCF